MVRRFLAASACPLPYPGMRRALMSLIAHARPCVLMTRTLAPRLLYALLVTITLPPQTLMSLNVCRFALTPL